MADFWTPDRVDTLIQLWEESPALYDIKSQLYTSRIAKHNAVKKIADGLGTSEHEVKKKMESLRTQYGRYLKLPASGSEGGKTTARQEWFLSRLQFLRTHMKKRQSQSNMDTTFDMETACSMEEAEEGEENEENEENEPPATGQPEAEPGWNQPSKRKKRRSAFTEAQAQDLAMLNTLTESIKSLTAIQSVPTLPPPPPDNITAYCKYLEGELRGIRDPQQLRGVMFQINQILYSSSQPVPQNDFGYRY